MTLLRTVLASLLCASLLPGPVRAMAPEETAEAGASTPSPTEERGAETPATPVVPAEPSREVGDANPMQDRLIDEATKHFKQAKLLYDQGDYGGAAAEFERSYAAFRFGSALRNIALSHSKAGAPVPGIRAARQYLALPDCGTEEADPIHCAQDRKGVERTLERMLRQVGELQLVLEPGVEIAKVRVAGRVVPPEDFPIVLEPGPIEVLISGTSPDEEMVRVVRMKPGETTSVYVPPFGQGRQNDAPPDEVTGPDDEERRLADLERRRRRKRALRNTFWAGLGFTVAAGASVGVLGALTMRDKDTYEREQDDLGDGAGPPEDVHDRFYRLRTATNAMVAVTAVVGMATVVLALFAFTPEQTAGRRASTRRWRVSPGGVQVRF